jgi:hypothetical protein
MKFNDNFSSLKDTISIFNQKNVPLFQNKVYKTKDQALAAETGTVELVQSSISGFVFNKTFDSSIMNYDENYQNEQSNSTVFQDHLKKVFKILNDFGLQNKKIIEIGCGKGIFFDILQKHGLDCWGFDPTYEGKNERIIKEYFDERYSGINADVIIMRHTLEHITQPFSFIHTIAKANNYQGKLFVEVPTFDWIVEKKAFWDVFYEHCNYFTEDTLGSMFEDSITGNFFGEQYIYLWADLSKLKPEIAFQNFTLFPVLFFEETIEKYRSMIRQLDNLIIWGAGAKGSTFLNLLDKDREHINYVVDINPRKQNRFIACTGHPIYGPKKISETSVKNILVSNENYIQEISDMLNRKDIKLISL